MSLPPKAGTSGGYKNCDIPNYVRGLALGVVDGETSTAPLCLKLATNMYGVKRFDENPTTKQTPFDLAGGLVFIVGAFLCCQY